METERIALSQRERDRLRVLQDVQQGHLTQVAAAQRIKITDRQVRRLATRRIPFDNIHQLSYSPMTERRA